MAKGQVLPTTSKPLRLVFSDTWAILRTAIDEGMSSGLREKVLNLYLSVVEPFFSLPVRSEELAKVKVRCGSWDSLLVVQGPMSCPYQ